jgi:hypothetical protein
MENPNFILIDDDKIMLFLIEFENKNILTIVPLKAILNLMSLLILFMTTLVS